jgi:L-fuculokinase
MADYQIVVLDIGKTNKKLLVYDSSLKCLNREEKGVAFPPVRWDGVLCDDAPAVYRWMIEGLKAASQRFKHIRAISVSTHGATMALLGECRDRVFKGDGGLVFPIVSYEQEVTPEEEAHFYRDMQLSPEEMQRQTATARLGWLLNVAKQIHWLEHRYPEQFKEVTDVLMYPQYFGLLLTGKKAAEPTALGCHGYLFDLSGERYSVVAERLGIANKLPPFPLRCSWEPLGFVRPSIVEETGLPAECVVTMGVHDSNAALVPYFVMGLKDFVVQDSGTWVVTMSVRDKAEFEKGEIGKDVFYNRSIYGDPVKTALFRGGAEFEFYRDRVLPGAGHPEGMNVELLEEIVTKREAFSLPAIVKGAGIFPRSTASFVGVDTIFANPETAWCVIDLGLAVQGCEAIRMAGGDKVASIFIEGNIGRNNPVYRGVISSLFPSVPVSVGSSGGAAYGAAVLAVAAVEGRRPHELTGLVKMEHKEVPKLGIDQKALQAYVKEFLKRTEEAPK